MYIQNLVKYLRYTFTNLVNDFNPLAVNTNSSIIDVHKSSECTTENTTKGREWHNSIYLLYFNLKF